MSETISNYLRSPSGNASREKWRHYAMARKPYGCEGYGKKLAPYVRRRTEPVEREAENFRHVRRPRKKGRGAPIAGEGPPKDRFGRFADRGNSNSTT
jgi:hypothetical protein